MSDIDRFSVVVTGGGVPPVNRMPRKWGIIEIKPEGHPDSPTLFVVVSQTDQRDVIMTVTQHVPDHDTEILFSTMIKSRPLEVRFGPEAD